MEIPSTKVPHVAVRFPSELENLLTGAGKICKDDGSTGDAILDLTEAYPQGLYFCSVLSFTLL